MKLYRIISVTDKETGKPSQGSGAKHVGQLAQFISLPLVGIGAHIVTPINSGFVTSRVTDVQSFGEEHPIVAITTMNTVYVFQEEPSHESL